MHEPAHKRPSDTLVEMNQIVMPQHTNALGTAFGGTVMSWIDVCAAVSAQRHCRRAVVTASMDQLDFLKPIRAGQLVNLRSTVNFSGRTSMEVGVRVEAENMLTGERTHAVSAYLTFVAIDADGRPCDVPQLHAESPDERLRWDEALVRRAQRLELATRRRELAQQHQLALVPE
ncbi:MAG: acyl-CoA thioesterase [Myxococcales bacterium]|nr:acyl-CoA thioesterase [Myxococcales bacterium]